MPPRGSPAPTPGGGNMRPSAPPLGFLAGLQLNADQQRDRRQMTDDTESSDGGENPDGTVLLEQPTRSYTQPRKPTGQEKQAAQQRQLQRTQESLFPTSSREERMRAGEEESGEQAPPRRRRGGGMQRGEADGGRDTQTAATEEQMAMQIAQQQQMASEIDRVRELEARTAEVSGAVGEAQASAGGQVEAMQRLQRLWRVLAGIEALSGWGIVMLIVQINLQVANNYFYKSKAFPPTTCVEDLACACLDLAACIMQFLCCFAYLWPMALLVWALEHKWETFSSLFGTLFSGVF